MPARLRPHVVLALLWAAYFHPLLLQPRGTLYADYSDFLAEHLPAKIFLNREWRETGELPRWNPYHFCGTPFVHDVQVGIFYPPYAVTYLVPEGAVGAALSWVIALHVLAAGAFALGYARWRGLGEVGALVAAVGFMLSAKWMTHLLLAGHTVTVGLAWLPLVLLGLERAIRGGVWPAVGAGVAFALLLLGTHPQWALYAGVFAGVWTLGAALEGAGYFGGPGERNPARTRRAVRRWLACGLGAVAVAVALTAVQLLPTLEAAGQSTRTGGLGATASLKVGFFALLALVGPSAVYDPPSSWEVRGLLGVYWLAAALAAARVAGGRARFEVGVLVGLLVFSAGGAVLVEWLPGFSLFRNPARMLLVAAFPLALLAGATTDALVRTGWPAVGRRVVRRFLLGVVLFAVAPSLLCLGAVLARREAQGPVWPPFVVYWAVVAATLSVVLWLLLPTGQGVARVRTRCWAGVLLAELVAPVAALPAVRPQAKIYPPSRTSHFLTRQARPGVWRVMDRDVGSGIANKLSVFGVGSPAALIYRLETPRGYNPLDVRHYREFVGHIIGLEAPVRGMDPVAQPIIPNFEVTHRGLFDLLNVRYFSTPAPQELDERAWTRIAQEPEPPLIPAIPPNPPAHLPPYFLFDNTTVRPRAFVVPEARPMPAGREQEALVACDFGRTVLLTTDTVPPVEGAGTPAPATVTEHRPNRVTIAPGGPGYLVLADVWYPGWVCRIDGREVPVHRANHAFRAVAVPAGAREVVFSFEPRSYRIGWWVSCGALGALVAFGVVNRRLRFRLGRSRPS